MFKCSGQKTFGEIQRGFFYIESDFRTVAYGVLNFLFAYVFLLIGFAVSFMVVFPQTEAFHNVPTAFVKVVKHFVIV